VTEPGLAHRGSSNRGSDVAEAARGLVFAAILAALAGLVDVIGYLHLKGLFISFMSGNSTQLAAALGQGDFAGAAAIAELIGLFVLGAAAGQMLADFTGKWHMTAVLIGVALLLAVAAVLTTSPEPMVFAMGAMNAAMHRAGKVPVSLTFVTGTLVRFGQGLGRFLARRGTGWNWLAQAAPWVGMIAGATIGGAAYTRIGDQAIWLPIALAVALSAGSVLVPQPD
jgi:uncharacterized membrane protein YoaK (UPF0700 family)